MRVEWKCVSERSLAETFVSAKGYNKSIDKAWVFVMFNDYVPFAPDNVFLCVDAQQRCLLLYAETAV